MAKSKNRGRKITKRKRRQNYTKRRRRQLGRGLTSSNQSKPPVNNTNALKKSLFDIPVYENGKQTERTTPLDATLIEQTNDPFMLEDNEKFKQYGPSYPGISDATKLRNIADRERKQKRIMDNQNRESLQVFSKLYSNSEENTPEWIKTQLDEYLKSEGK